MNTEENSTEPVDPEERPEPGPGLYIPLSMRGKLWTLQALLLGLIIISTNVGVLQVTNPTISTPLGPFAFKEGVISSGITASLVTGGIIACNYTSVIDTGIPDNPYAESEVVIELWVGDEMVKELNHASWNITGYTVASKSTYIYTLSWTSNLTDLGVLGEKGLLKVLPANTRQANLTTETEIDLVYFEGVISTELTARLLPGGELRYNYNSVIDTGIPGNAYETGEVIAQLWIDGKMSQKIGHFSWDITGYPVTPGSSYTYSTGAQTNILSLEIREGSQVVLKIVSVDPAKTQLMTETKVQLPSP